MIIHWFVGCFEGQLSKLGWLGWTQRCQHRLLPSPPKGTWTWPLDAKKIHHPPRNVSGWTVIQYLDAPYGKRNSWPEICGETTSEVDFSTERTSECILMVFLVLASQGDVQVPQLLVFWCLWNTYGTVYVSESANDYQVSRQSSQPCTVYRSIPTEVS